MILVVAGELHPVCKLFTFLEKLKVILRPSVFHLFPKNRFIAQSHISNQLPVKFYTTGCFIVDKNPQKYTVLFWKDMR